MATTGSAEVPWGHTLRTERLRPFQILQLRALQLIILIPPHEIVHSHVGRKTINPIHGSIGTFEYVPRHVQNIISDPRLGNRSILTPCIEMSDGTVSVFLCAP